MSNDDNTEKFLHRKAVGELIGVKGITLWRWERAGKFPKSFKLDNGDVRYLNSEVRAWMRDQLQAARGAQHDC